MREFIVETKKPQKEGCGLVYKNKII